MNPPTRRGSAGPGLNASTPRFPWDSKKWGGARGMRGAWGCSPRSSQRWGSGEASRGQAGQAEVGVGEEAEVDGVAIEADVLQRPADVAVVLAVAERVLVHGLDVVVLEGEAKGKAGWCRGLCIPPAPHRWGFGAGEGTCLTWRCRERRLSGRGVGT